MLTIKVKSFFYLVRGSIISLSLYKNYKLIVYLGHLENVTTQVSFPEN